MLNQPKKTLKQLAAENKKLTARLEEAEETLRAIRSGEVDALIVSGEYGEQVFTLTNADRPFRNLVEEMNEGALTVMQDGIILYANRCFSEMLKTPLEKVIGSTFLTWIAHADEKSFQSFLQKGANDKHHQEFLLIASDGAQVPINLSVSSAPNEMPLSFCLVATDLTEQKRSEAVAASEMLEKAGLVDSKHARQVLLNVIEDQMQATEEIQKLNETLEKRVAQRTLQLQTSNEELEAFAYSVSHDLRAPLRAIDGYSRILQQEYSQKLDDEGLRLLGVVRTSTSKMDHLITDLLALSRVGRSELNFSQIKMNELVNSIYLELATPEVMNKFTFKVTDLPNVPGDQTLVRQVWVNLISNAIKYTMPKEKGIIEITGSIEHGYCTYTIKDNGVGFNPDFTNKLFGLFQRLHKATDFEGTGVGLAIVHRIILRHGGYISGEGKIGNGATFTFSIPERQVSNE